jgi:hypothetical protein
VCRRPEALFEIWYTNRHVGHHVVHELRPGLRVRIEEGAGVERLVTGLEEGDDGRVVHLNGVISKRGKAIHLNNRKKQSDPITTGRSSHRQSNTHVLDGDLSAGVQIIHPYDMYVRGRTQG